MQAFCCGKGIWLPAQLSFQVKKATAVLCCAWYPVCYRCGANHSFMPIVVEAISPRQFLTEYVKKWIE